MSARLYYYLTDYDQVSRLSRVFSGFAERSIAATLASIEIQIGNPSEGITSLMGKELLSLLVQHVSMCQK